MAPTNGTTTGADTQQETTTPRLVPIGTLGLGSIVRLEHEGEMGRMAGPLVPAEPPAMRVQFALREVSVPDERVVELVVTPWELTGCLVFSEGMRRELARTLWLLREGCVGQVDA